MSYLWVFIGGGLGSLVRYGLSNVVSGNSNWQFPIATLISNVVACIILGIIVVGFVSKGERYEWLSPLLAVGFCGGLSTFSTFSLENWQLIQGGQITMAILNMAISIGAGIVSLYFISSRI